MKKWLVLMAVFSLLFWCKIANSTTVQYLNDQELTKRADVVFTGKCLGKKSSWNQSHTRIYTVYTFKVTTKLKGKKQNQIVTFKQWGGQVGNFRYYIAGLASFKANENVFTFLTPQGKKGFRFTVGLAQGKLKIMKNKKGRRYLLRNTLGLRFHKSAKKGGLEVVPDYDGFEKKIRGYVQEELKHKNK